MTEVSSQIVAGKNYKMTLKFVGAEDEEDIKVFEVMVWKKLDESLQLLSQRELPLAGGWQVLSEEELKRESKYGEELLSLAKFTSEFVPEEVKKDYVFSKVLPGAKF